MDPSSRNILFIFVSLWFLALIMAVNRVFELYEISDASFILLLLSVFSFVIGFSLISVNPKANIDFTDIKVKSQIECILDSRIFQILILILFVYMLYLYSIFLAMLIFLMNCLEERA